MSIRLLFAILNLILRIPYYYLQFKGKFVRKVMGVKKILNETRNSLS